MSMREGSRMPTQRVLVTGGAGFIGSAFVRTLLASEERTYEVLTYDALTYAGHEENLTDLPNADRHTFVRGDITRADDVRTTCRSFQPMAVVNFAAETHVDQSLETPATFVRTNVLGTQVLLDVCREVSARLVHVSTDEVYGDLPDPLSATPDSLLAPSSPYAASKAAADLLVQAFHRSFEADVVITRCTNNYGPRQLPEKLIPLMILRAASGAPLPVYGDGRQVRDWIHVQDHAAGVQAALERGRRGAIYHFAGRTTLPNLDVVEQILEQAGETGARVEHVRDRPGHDRRYALDDSATREELAWAPSVGFPEGLAATTRWYLSNPEWIRQVAGPELSAFLARNYRDR